MDIHGVVARWFPGAAVGSIERLDGGDVNDVYRVAVDGRPVVLRVYEAATSGEMVAWEHELLAEVAAAAPEAIAPLATVDGATWVEVEGRVTSMWRFVEGRRADRLIEGDRDAAARVLGRLHGALGAPGSMGWDTRPGYPMRREVDWRENRLWSWARADRGEVGRRVDLDEFERALDEVPRAIRELDVSGLPVAPIHGDFGADNLLVADGEVVAVLDWDWCRLDWRAWETASAVWAFCRDESATMVDREAAARFLDGYEAAGGAVLPGERAAFGLLIEASRLWEALYVLGEIERGLPADWEYFEMNVAAMRRFRGFEMAG